MIILSCTYISPFTEPKVTFDTYQVNKDGEKCTEKRRVLNSAKEETKSSR